jgi:signal transduction histidine kinase
MAQIGQSIASRLTIGVMLVHLLVLPILYSGMVYLIKQSNEEYFLNYARGHTRFIADSLERLDSGASDEAIAELLDTVVLSGTGVFADVVGNARQVSSTLVSADDATKFEEDYGLRQHADDRYFFSVPLTIGDEILTLRVGFDESPLWQQDRLAYKNGLVAIALYLAALLVLLTLFSRQLVRPIKKLQAASRKIASGAAAEHVFAEHLTVDSNLFEIVELSRDLESMRGRLMGINEELQREIKERERAEARRLQLVQQLRHSQRLEAVGTMAGGIAHEINNILVPIILYTDTAIEDLPEDSRIREDLGRVLNAATRAKGIVNQVLTFSHRIETGSEAPTDIALVVRDCAELLRVSTPPHIDIILQIEPNCPPVAGNASSLSQVILNLCTNAIQAIAGNPGKVTIKVGVMQAERRLIATNPLLGRGRCVCLSVSDTGGGMEEETIERIFEPFFTTRGVGAGTGLGLSVVHGIVTHLDGVIEVQSALQSGSTFYVYLPALEPSSPSDKPADR